MLQDLIHRVSQNIRRFEERKERPTEEATKHALVLPFISDVIGADYHDPDEVIPEYIADIGHRKGEKVDYAICRDGEPIILIECKALHASLDDDAVVQLRRYVGSLPGVSLGVLTDGRTYRFYADLDEPNILDTEPFLDVDLLEMSPESQERIKCFHLDQLDVEVVKEYAYNWKTVASIVQILEKEWTNPSREYIEVFARNLHHGSLTEPVRKQYANYLKQAHRLFLQHSAGRRQSSAQKPDHEVSGTPNQDPEDQPSVSWQPLTNLATTDRLSQKIRAIRFPDGSITQVDSWAGLLRTIVQKLDSEGHFSSDNIPSRLQYYIKRISEHEFRQYVDLPSGWAVNTSLGRKDILKRAIRFLEEYRHDLENVHIALESDPTPVVLTNEFRSLTSLNPTDPAPRIVQFEDGSTAEIKYWADLFRAVAHKLAAEGHFQPEKLTHELHSIIRERRPVRAKVPWIKLGDRQYIRDHGSASDRFNMAMRLLTLCGFDPAKCIAK